MVFRSHIPAKYIIPKNIKSGGLDIVAIVIKILVIQSFDQLASLKTNNQTVK